MVHAVILLCTPLFCREPTAVLNKLKVCDSVPNQQQQRCARQEMVRAKNGLETRKTWELYQRNNVSLFHAIVSYVKCCV